MASWNPAVSWMLSKVVSRALNWSPNMTESPTYSATFTLRLPEVLLHRAEHLLGPIQEDPCYLGVRVSKQFVFRRALALGIQELERSYPDREAQAEACCGP